MGDEKKTAGTKKAAGKSGTKKAAGKSGAKGATASKAAGKKGAAGTKKAAGKSGAKGTTASKAAGKKGAAAKKAAGKSGAAAKSGAKGTAGKSGAAGTKKAAGVSGTKGAAGKKAPAEVPAEVPAPEEAPVPTVTDEELEAAVEELNGASRIKRQKASHLIAQVADVDAARLLEFADDIGEGLLHPEAQTRWETLHTLVMMGRAGQTYGEDVLGAAEEALYDEANGVVRQAAFRFFCGYGAASPANSDRVWPLIDEAVRCFHGDPEYSEMLTDLVAFAQGNVSMEALSGIAWQMKFDSETAHGTLRMRSEQVVAAFKARGGEFPEPEPEPGEDTEDGTEEGDGDGGKNSGKSEKSGGGKGK